jgi:hypothetical protein
MRRVFSRLQFAAWAVAVVALYALENPLTMFRMISGRHAERDAGPDTGLSGAGVLAPLNPPPPILFASVAMELPRSDVDEA